MDEYKCTVNKWVKKNGTKMSCLHTPSIVYMYILDARSVIYKWKNTYKIGSKLVIVAHQMEAS